MRIGVNALYLLPGGVGGTEIYLRELLKALAAIDTENQYFVFHNRETGPDLVPTQGNFHSQPQAVSASVRPARILWEQLVIPFEAAKLRLDVLFNPGFTAPLLSPCPCVTTFHDLQHKRHPEYFRWFDMPFWNVLLWGAARKSARIVSVSQATTADFVRYYGAGSKVRTIPSGTSEEFFTLKRDLVEPYVLCVSTLHPHKNLERLVRVFAAKPRDYRLVLAGMRGFRARQVEELIASLGASGRIRVTGWIPREELLTLYSRALAFIYPSTFEGFGMPPLEAMAAGIPTACSNIAPLLETTGEAALHFDPLNDQALDEALGRIVSDQELRERLAKDGPEQARKFSWDSSARSLLRVWKEVLPQ